MKRPNLLQSPQMHLTAGNLLLPIATLVAGAFLMIAAAIVAWRYAISAERKSLEEIARPLASME